MRKIVYYVATSIDGLISGEEDDISDFAMESKGIDKYLSDLKKFDTVIMGRKTYEFGYKFGLKPGEPAYPHMKHYIFSNSMKLDCPVNNVMICNLDLSIINNLKSEKGTDIYLCGGGEFAGWLLDNEMIDILKIKLNPLILGKGIPLFGSSIKKYKLNRVKNETYNHGLEIITYTIQY